MCISLDRALTQGYPWVLRNIGKQLTEDVEEKLVENEHWLKLATVSSTGALNSLLSFKLYIFKWAILERNKR